MTSLRKGELRVGDGNILLATHPLPPLDMPVCWWSSFNPWLPPPPIPPRTLTLSWDTASSIIKSQYSKPTHPPNPITCFTFRAPLDVGAGEGKWFLRGQGRLSQAVPHLSAAILSVNLPFMYKHKDLKHSKRVIVVGATFVDFDLMSCRSLQSFTMQLVFLFPMNRYSGFIVFCKIIHRTESLWVMTKDVSAFLTCNATCDVYPYCLLAP